MKGELVLPFALIHYMDIGQLHAEVERRLAPGAKVSVSCIEISLDRPLDNAYVTIHWVAVWE